MNPASQDPNDPASPCSPLLPASPQRVPDQGTLGGSNPTFHVPQRVGVAPVGTPRPVPKVTVVETIYHQIPGEQATQYGEPWEAELVSDEQPYVRRIEVKDKWQPLEFMWLQDNVGMVSLRNAGKSEVFVGMFPEEAGGDEPQLEPLLFARLLPGESARWRPYNVERLCIRCTHGGTCKVFLVAFPL